MKSRHAFGLLLLSVLLLVNIISPQAMGQNHPPLVSNVHAGQRLGTKLVDITYDVSDPDGDPLTIAVAVSDDGGATFNVPVLTFSGDVGAGILPGGGKKIVWNAGVDYPNVYRTNCQVKITAFDENGGEGFCPSEDGSPMILIPAGDFLMGDSFSEGGKDERPVHTVYVDSFCIDVYEVTNALYAEFLNSYGNTVDGAGNELIDINHSQCLIEEFEGKYRAKPSQENNPAVMISWFGATEYAKFYGKRLPTEAEWEKAARGGLVGARYP